MVKHVQFQCPTSQFPQKLNRRRSIKHCMGTKSLKGVSFVNRSEKHLNDINKRNVFEKELYKLLRQSDRMEAGTDYNDMQDKKYIDVKANEKCACLGNRTATPRINVCEKCGGYAYTGQNCADFPLNDITVKSNNDANQSEKGNFTCCPCRINKSEVKQMKTKAVNERIQKNNPLIGGPFADKLATIFLPGNKGRLPAIVGYHSDGAPIYGPPGGASNITGYNADGTPIYLPGTGGATDKSLIMGYKKDGTPIHPPSSSNPKESMAIIGTYVKDGSPIIGNIKLAGGMVMKGVGKDGNPAYSQLSGSGGAIGTTPLTTTLQAAVAAAAAQTQKSLISKLSSTSNAEVRSMADASKLKPGKQTKPSKIKPEPKVQKKQIDIVKKEQPHRPVTPVSASVEEASQKVPVKKKWEPKIKKVWEKAEKSKKEKKKEKDKVKEIQDLLEYYEQNLTNYKGMKAYKKLVQLLQNFYPHANHSSCLEKYDRIPKDRGWSWQNRTNGCCSSQSLPYWFHPCYKPGAVPTRIAKQIEMDRNCNVCPRIQTRRHLEHSKKIGNRSNCSCSNCSICVPPSKPKRRL